MVPFINILSVAVWFKLGRFLAELTKQVFSDLTASKYQVNSSFFFGICKCNAYLRYPYLTCSIFCFHQMAEYRISIYGRKQSEWDNLASWIVNNELSSENVVWLVQVPFHYFCSYLALEISIIVLQLLNLHTLN